jgi:predicted 3-demethylubiquinone-9 3-methyltransferase (glyoxalase superfamily)
MQKITPSLWFDKTAEEAMNFYTAIFSNSKIISIERYPEEAPADFMEGMEGRVLTGIFEIEGHRFMALDGGPLFTFNPSVSFFVNCKTKEEVNKLWEALSKEGETLMPLGEYPFSEWFGWVQDKYGLSWQLILAEGSVEQKIVPCMMFVGENCGRAEAAINFYASNFDRSEVVNLMQYEAGSDPQKEGTVMFADFKLESQLFAAMDSALEHGFIFNEAISFYVECENQTEVDHFWKKFSAIPEAEQCGWLKDKYGLSWQIVPKHLGQLLGDPDREKAERVMQAMLQGRLARRMRNGRRYRKYRLSCSFCNGEL